jgi:hypothetical protein
LLKAAKKAGRAVHWSYFTPVVGLDKGQKPACRLKCIKCDKEFRINNPTSLHTEHIKLSQCAALKQQKAQALLADEVGSPSSKRTAASQGSTVECSAFKQARLAAPSYAQLQQAAKHLCRFFYHNNVAFQLVEDPHLLAFARTLGMAELPTRHQLANKFLDDEFATVQKQTKEEISDLDGSR